MVYAGILAGGLGVRMHRIDLPKQFLMLGSKPIIIHTLEQFLFNSRIDRIVIVAPENWMLYTQDLVKQYESAGKEISYISGGENKADSIAKLAEHIEKTWGTCEEDILISHDAIRPFVTQRIIDENIDGAMSFGAISTIMATTDTIASVRGDKVFDIPPKEQMFAEQTPQSFNIELLQRVLAEADKKGVTPKTESDVFRLFVLCEIAIKTVMGEYSNIKIINPYDLEVANALLRLKGND